MTVTERITRRDYLRLLTMAEGVPWPLTLEAVATTALAYPEWDMDEERSLSCWLVEYPPSDSVRG
jgi:hypothetical protein